MLPLGDFGIPNSPTLRSRCNPNSNTALSCHKIDAEMQCIIMNCANSEAVPLGASSQCVVIVCYNLKLVGQPPTGWYQSSLFCNIEGGEGVRGQVE